MKKPTYLLGSLLLCLISTSVFAECAARAVYRAPEIPDLKDTSFEQAVQLEAEVKFYIQDADQRLQECGRKASPFAHNVAIGRMERVARAYNEIAEFYNRATVASNNVASN